MDDLKFWAVTIMLVWHCVEFGIDLSKHGQMCNLKVGPTIIFTIINFFLLLLGGFFVVFAWPQIVWLILSTIGVTILVSGTNFERKRNILSSTFSYSVLWFVYYKGGFWFN